MQSLLYLLRVGIFFIGGYALFRPNPLMGIIIFGTGLFSFLFKLRKPLFLSPSSSARLWELGGVALVLVNSVILSFAGYDSLAYGWVDIPMHLGGGIFVAFWGTLAFQKELKTWPMAKSMVTVLGIVAFVGLGWEFFEWIYDQSLSFWYHLPIAQPSVKDTIGDLVFNLVGGCVVIAFSFTKKGGMTKRAFRELRSPAARLH